MVLDAANNFDYDTDHSFMNSTVNGQCMDIYGGAVLPLAVHYGDIEMALAQFDKSLDVLRRCMEESVLTPELVTLTKGVAINSHIAVTCELPADRREAVAAVMAAWGQDWHTGNAKANQIAESFAWYRKRGDKTRNGGATISTEV